MTFSPNDFERYTAALRNTTQNFIIKKGILPKYTANLRKIHIAEGLSNANSSEPINIDVYLFNLFSAVSKKKIQKNSFFCFEIEKMESVIINKKLITCLLLILCKKAERINVFFNFGCLNIISDQKNNCPKVLKALKGSCLFEIKTQKSIISIPAVKTDKKSTKIEKDYFDFNNPLSLLNIFLN